MSVTIINFGALRNPPSVVASETRTHFPGGQTGLFFSDRHQLARNPPGSGRPEWDARDPTPRPRAGPPAGATRVRGRWMDAPPAPGSRPLLLPFRGWASARGPGAGRRPGGPWGHGERRSERTRPPARPRARTGEAPTGRSRGNQGAPGVGPPSRRPRPAPGSASSPRAARTAGPPRGAGEAEDPGRPRTREGGSRGRPQPEGTTRDRAVLGDLECVLRRRRARSR